MGQSNSVLAEQQQQQQQQHPPSSSSRNDNDGSTVSRALQRLLEDDSDDNYYRLKQACQDKPAHLVEEEQLLSLVAMLQTGEHTTVLRSLEALLLILTPNSSSRIQQFTGKYDGKSTFCQCCGVIRNRGISDCSPLTQLNHSKQGSVACLGGAHQQQCQ